MASLAEVRLPEPGPTALPVPDHVPAALVKDLHFAMGDVPNDLDEPYTPCDVLRDPSVPRVLWYPYPMGGSLKGGWAVSHYDDIRRVYEDNDAFSAIGAAQFQAFVGETFPSLPLGTDPPEHGKYRKFLNPFFTPVAMLKLEPRIRALIESMIDTFADRGEVDIAWDFGRVFPVRVFLGLMKFPDTMFDQFLDWEYKILHLDEFEVRQEALRGIIAYLRGFIAEKEAHPDDGIASHIANGTIEGRPLTADEKIGMTFFLWLGGLDTVASTISQMFRRLGQDQALQARLRAHPELINSAVEEFLRVQPLVNSVRWLKHDMVWHGVAMKKGDPVCCVNSSGNFDAEQFRDPLSFDPARIGNRHFTFVGGVHACLGAHLARRELRTLLQVFFEKVPTFRIKQGADTTVNPGLLSVRNLPIVWDPA